MLLTELRIARQRFGEQRGKVIGKIEFEGKAGSIALNLSSDQCEQIFDVVAGALETTAKEAANNLRCNIIEHQKSPNKSRPSQGSDPKFPPETTQP